MIANIIRMLKNIHLMQLILLKKVKSILEDFLVLHRLLLVYVKTIGAKGIGFLITTKFRLYYFRYIATIYNAIDYNITTTIEWE